MTYNSNMFEAGRGSIYKSPPKSSSNANKQAAGSMKSAGIGGIGGKPTTSSAKKIQDQFKRETQKDNDRKGLGSNPKVTPTPQKSFLESLYDRVRGSITFAGGDPDRKKKPTPNPGALYTASPFIIPAATAVTASVLGPAVDYTDPTQVPTEMPRIYTPASRDFGKGTEPMSTPEKPETAKFDVTDLLGLKEKVARGDAPGLMAPPSMDQPAAPATARSAAMTAGINKVLKDVIAPKGKEYKIKGGDTLSAISRREGVSVDDLVKINGIEDKDKIYAGDSIIIPKPEEVEQAKEFVLRVSTRGDEVDSTDPDAQYYESFRQGIMSPPTEGPINVRNNNLGNIKNISANNWKGQNNLGTSETFAKFDTPELGIRALKKVIDANIRATDTFEEYVNRYASEPNEKKYFKEKGELMPHLKNYAKIIAGSQGIKDIKSKLPDMSNIDYVDWIKATAKAEGGEDTLNYFTDDVIETGIDIK